MIYRLLGKLMYDQPDIRNRVGSRIWFENQPEFNKLAADQRGACIIIRAISERSETHLQNECDMAQPMVQIDAYDENPTKADSLNELIRLLLSGYGPATVSVLDSSGDETDVFVSSIVKQSGGMATEEPVNGSDRWVYRRFSVYEVFHSQSVPTHA